MLCVGCVCLLGCWPEEANISGDVGKQFGVMCVCAGRCVFWDDLVVFWVCSCACKVYCVGYKDLVLCRAVMVLLSGHRLEFGKVSKGALALFLGVLG